MAAQTQKILTQEHMIYQKIYFEILTGNLLSHVKLYLSSISICDNSLIVFQV